METVQPVLIQSCDTLVNGDGCLTQDGTHAMHCIRNGIPMDVIFVELKDCSNYTTGHLVYDMLPVVILIQSRH
jgi:hypothetical protein